MRLTVFLSFLGFNAIASQVVGLSLGLGGLPKGVVGMIMYPVYVATIAGPLLLALRPSKATLGLSLLPATILILVFLMELIESLAS